MLFSMFVFAPYRPTRMTLRVHFRSRLAHLMCRLHFRFALQITRLGDADR
jgi:hypothetical protein